MEFLSKWYGRLVHIDQIPNVFTDWINADWQGKMPTLLFTRPETFTPWIKRTVEVVDIVDAGIVELRFEISNNISDPWYRVVNVESLPKIVADFLQIDAPKEEPVYISLGPAVRWWEHLRR